MTTAMWCTMLMVVIYLIISFLDFWFWSFRHLLVRYDSISWHWFKSHCFFLLLFHYLPSVFFFGWGKTKWASYKKVNLSTAIKLFRLIYYQNFTNKLSFASIIFVKIVTQTVFVYSKRKKENMGLGKNNRSSLFTWNWLEK